MLLYIFRIPLKFSGSELHVEEKPCDPVGIIPNGNMVKQASARLWPVSDDCCVQSCNFHFSAQQS